MLPMSVSLENMKRATDQQTSVDAEVDSTRLRSSSWVSKHAFFLEFIIVEVTDDLKRSCQLQIISIPKSKQ